MAFQYSPGQLRAPAGNGRLETGNPGYNFGGIPCVYIGKLSFLLASRPGYRTGQAAHPEEKYVTAQANHYAETTAHASKLLIFKRPAVNHALTKRLANSPWIFSASKSTTQELRNLAFIVTWDCAAMLIPTSGPFGDSMSAAARPNRWGVFR
jgi:hypothetical protein